jgi:hypothetical protein
MYGRRAVARVRFDHYSISFISAVDFHTRHLRIARLLKDRVGESRACFSLANAFRSLDDHPKALYFVALNYKLANEVRVGDRFSDA